MRQFTIRTNAPPSPRELERLDSPNLNPRPEPTPEQRLKEFQIQLDKAREARLEGDYKLASNMLIYLLEAATPESINREALYELALTIEKAGMNLRAQQIYAQFISHYPKDPLIPEIHLRRGLLFRRMGVHQMAKSAFFSAMSQAITVDPDEVEDYRRLALQAQTEIADTYFFEGDYANAATYYRNLLKQEFTEINKAEIHYKLVQAIAYGDDPAQAVGAAREFLARYPASEHEPEVRFILARSLKQMQQHAEAAQEVMKLLRAEKGRYESDPDHYSTWLYWQQRAGNEIGNSLYKEGEYQNALHVYLRLAQLNPSPAWQLPVQYQIGLCSEHLDFTAKALEAYRKILEYRGEIPKEELSPSLRTVMEMAEWRLGQIAWKEKAKSTSEALKNELANQLPPTPSQDETSLESLASIYSYMEPDVAVTILKEMPDDLLLAITRAMKTTDAAAIYTAMAALGKEDARRAARLSEILSLKVAKAETPEP